MYQRRLVSNATARSIRAIGGTIVIWLRAALFIGILEPNHSIANEQCQYPDTIVSLAVAPRDRLGEFRIELNAPDYHSVEAVQQHLAFSTVWAKFLDSELRAATSNRCSAAIAPTLFPDLRVYLSGTRVAGNAEGSPLSCEKILRDIVSKQTPGDKMIAALAGAEARSRLFAISHPVGGALDAGNLLNSALVHIYDVTTVMHALVSVDSATFSSLDVRAFHAWLDTQRSAGRAFLRPLLMCGSGGGPPSAEITAEILPYSGVAAPGIVTLSVAKGEAPLTGSSRHVVIVGQGDALANTPLNTPAALKFCSQKHTFPANGASTADPRVTVTIRCLRWVVYHQSWTVFYCDPKDRISEAEQKRVAAAIAADPDVVAHGRAGGPLQPLGPYIVSVE